MWGMLANLARCLPAEAAHRVAVTTLHHNLGPRPAALATKANLGLTLAGLKFANPIGLAAGFDKNAACFNGAMRLGFGHVEVGTITPLPQPGNPKPRVFRLPKHHAVINRYGFNSLGMDVAARNLQKMAAARTGILGVNVGANKTSQAPIDDYRRAVAHLARYADYITLNISSPNTPGLRNLQTKAYLADLLAAGRAGLDEAAGDGDVSTKPIFLKIAPDLHHDDLVAIVEACVEAGVSGIIATNTTLARPGHLDGVHADESGGLSGAPLFEAATAILADVARLSERRLGLIGAGGVANAWQAYAKILVGADLVQLYTGLALNGPELPAQILAELVDLMQADGVHQIAYAKGQIPHGTKAIQHAIRLSQTSVTPPAKS